MEPNEGWRVKPAYSLGETARLAGTTAATVRRWLWGYERPGHQMKPVFGAKDKRAVAVVSFLELAEIVVVAALRQKKNIKLERLRRAHAFAAERFGLDYPFATLKMKTDGVHVLTEYQHEEPGASLLALDMSGQWTLPGLVAERLEMFDFEATWAARWFPAGRNVPIVVDPRMGAGQPTVMDRGVTVEAIRRRWKAGQSIRIISSEYRLQTQVVEKVLQYSEKYAA